MLAGPKSVVRLLVANHHYGKVHGSRLRMIKDTDTFVEARPTEGSWERATGCPELLATWSGASAWWGGFLAIWQNVGKGFIPSSKYVKFVPFHPKNLPKGRNFTYLEDPGIFIYTIGMNTPQTNGTTKFQPPAYSNQWQTLVPLKAQQRNYQSIHVPLQFVLWKCVQRVPCNE